MPPCRKTQPGNWGNRSRGGRSCPKISGPLGQNNWGKKWGHYTQRQDRSYPKRLAKTKKSYKNDKQFYGTEVMGGVVTHKDKAAKAKFLCQHNFKKATVRLPYKAKYKMYCFKILPSSNLLLQHHCPDTK